MTTLVSARRLQFNLFMTEVPIMIGTSIMEESKPPLVTGICDPLYFSSVTPSKFKTIVQAEASQICFNQQIVLLRFRRRI